VKRVDAEPRSIRDALRLRGVALPVLAGRAPDAAGLDELRRASADAWRIMLARECCALPLAAGLRALRLDGTLSSGARAALAAAELAETQRVLAARSSLAALDAAAAALEVRLTVLKGGALAAEPAKPPLDLGDVDVLVDDAAPQTLWRRLSALGWRPRAGAPVETLWEADANHLVPIVPPNEGLAVEIHTSIDYGANRRDDRATLARPLASRRALSRLVGLDGVIVLLQHSVAKHPHRRGHLRDLVLIADALSEAGRTIDEIEAALSADPLRDELLAMVRQAHALLTHALPDDDESTRRFAAWKYAMHGGARGVGGTLLPGWPGVATLALERPVVRRHAMRRLAREAIAPPSPSSAFAGIAGGRPGDPHRRSMLGGARPLAARMLRGGYRFSLLLLSVVAAPLVRRRIADLTRR
jgi:hypothetical protein